MAEQSVSAGVEPIHRARGILESAKPDSIVMHLPGTDYRLHLAVYKTPSTPVGKRIAGTIRAQARRIDSIGTGGAYVEPIMGEPRRIAGTVLATDASEQTITVRSCVPVVVKVGAGQRADQFAVGDMVAFDVMSGTSFTPA